MSRFSSKQVVAMVVAVCAAVVLAPVGVMAATGTLVNITDPVNSGRQAHVGSAGTLYVESRAGVVDHSINVVSSFVGDQQWHALYEVSAPNRIAITEATFTVYGPQGSGEVDYVRLYSRIRTSGTSSCQNGIGWTQPNTLRYVAVHVGDTKQIVFDGPPLVLPTPAAGQRLCVGFDVNVWQSDTSVETGITGYTFT